MQTRDRAREGLTPEIDRWGTSRPVSLWDRGIKPVYFYNRQRIDSFGACPRSWGKEEAHRPAGTAEARAAYSMCDTRVYDWHAAGTTKPFFVSLRDLSELCRPVAPALTRTRTRTRTELPHVSFGYFPVVSANACVLNFFHLPPSSASLRAKSYALTPVF